MIMKTKEVRFDGDLHLVVPDHPDFQWPAPSVLRFPPCCGPEKWNERYYIFDEVYGLRISPACFVHDVMWDLAEPSWGDFHYSNSIFLHNLLSIINTRSESSVLRFLRRHRAYKYYEAIDLFGHKYFWQLKNEKATV